MLNQQTIEKLHALKLIGMAEAFKDQLPQPDIDRLSFEERFGLIVRIASHARSYDKWQHTTLAEHMPKSHQKYLEWTPTRIIAWAGKNGPHTEALVSRILESRRHPEQGFRTCLGVMRLAKHYSPERLEAACARALSLNACSYKHVKSILENGLDKQPLPPASDSVKPVHHYNIRGKDYYQQKEADHA